MLTLVIAFLFEVYVVSSELRKKEGGLLLYKKLIKKKPVLIRSLIFKEFHYLALSVQNGAK